MKKVTLFEQFLNESVQFGKKGIKDLSNHNKQRYIRYENI